MLLGQKAHTAGNAIRYAVDYSNWLDDGVSLTAATVVLDPSFTATVKDIVITETEMTPSHKVVFLMTGGSINEAFTLDVQITDSRGEVKNDTCAFIVVKP